MNLIEAPVLAMPVRPENSLSFRQFIRLVTAVWTADDREATAKL
jgi:hypothetical protein